MHNTVQFDHDYSIIFLTVDVMSYSSNNFNVFTLK